jgi:hypothetical protein
MCSLEVNLVSVRQSVTGNFLLESKYAHRSAMTMLVRNTGGAPHSEESQDPKASVMVSMVVYGLEFRVIGSSGGV